MDSREQRPNKNSPRRWHRSGREQFVNAAVAYLDGLSEGAAGGDSGPSGVGQTAGAAELGIRLVASLVGKSPSAPLFHFPDRLTLLAAVAAEGFRRLTQFIRPERVARDGSSASPRQVLVNVALSYVEWAGEHGLLFAVMYTPALAPGVDAIQSGNEAFWGSPGDLQAGGVLPITEPGGRRRLAFSELHDAKVGAAAVFLSSVEEAKHARELSPETPSVDLLNAVIAMADGLAWQRVNERQQTPAMMRQHAERSIQLLFRGIGSR
jgi:AcrR family transcriptional regulator